MQICGEMNSKVEGKKKLLNKVLPMYHGVRGLEQPSANLAVSEKVA